MGRRYGPRASGLLVGLPLTSGPVIFFQALEQGQAFAAHAALGTLTGLIALSAFCLSYGRLAPRAPWLACALAGWASYLLLAWCLLGVELELLASALLVTAVLASVQKLLPRRESSEASSPASAWDLPFRIVAATSMVLLLTGMANSLGPRLSGLLAPFPIYASVVAISTHAHQGGGAALAVLRGVLLGSYGFALFFVTLSSTLVPWGIPSAFAAAASASTLMHLLLRFQRKRQEVEQPGKSLGPVVGADRASRL